MIVLRSNFNLSDTKRFNMNRTFILTLITVVFLFLGCNSDKPVLMEDFDMNQYINSYFAHPKGFDVDTVVTHDELLTNIYQNNQNESFWFSDNQPNAKAEQLFDLLTHSMYYGLDTTLYDLLTIRNFKQGLSQDTIITKKNKQSMLGYELCLTQSAILFFTHLHRGIMPFYPLEYITNEKIDSTSSYFQIYNYFDNFPQDSLVHNLFQVLKTDSIKEIINVLQPQNTHYLRLQQALEDYVKNNPINQDSIQVVYFEKDTVWTSTFENYRKACLALQKLRWSNITSKQYIFINAPSFTLDFVEENNLAVTHKIICGTIENQTPELNSRLLYIQTFPDWNVPYSIGTKEILPMVKRSTGYMAKHNYEVLDSKGNILDPDSVPWSKYSIKYFPVRIRQTAGYHNSLGCVKFYFANTASVYFHDTPTKNLFNKSFRSFSHGCMRLQNPVDFAKRIIDFDNNKENGATAKEIFQNKLQAKEKYIYNVKKNIPIYIRYLTAFCDENNKLCFAPDFYGRDSLLMVRFNEAVRLMVNG
jgi:murein L,D-transpeptidase YcbB/YkuD